jgi:prepilin-type processing-associated H-X9-DG protein
MTPLLPYIDQGELFRQIDMSLPWDHPKNYERFKTKINMFLHPAFQTLQSDNGHALTHYAGNIRVLARDRALRLADFHAGLTNTILAGEVAANFKPWGQPANWRDPARGLNRSPDGFGGPPRQPGVNLLMADGSVRFFSSDTDPDFLDLLAHPDPAR